MGALKDAARKARRMLHAAQGRDLWFDRQVRWNFVRLGSEYGGWSIRPELLSRHSVVYTFGVGDDVTFDLALIHKFGVHVHAFDPTPRSLAWVKAQTFPPEFHFHPIGIADFDGTARFVMRHADPTWNSYNLSQDTNGAHEVVEAPVKRLSTIMRELGHDHVDLLKLDIEGAEYGVLTDLLQGAVRPPQLLVEFHYWEGAKERVPQTDGAIRALNAAGYKIFARSPVGPEFSFGLG
jgi:FkbM family methyltransferase